MGEIQGTKILDAGCGQGYLSRLFTKRGAEVTRVEPGHDFVQYAIEREKEEKLGITYIKEDLSKLNTYHNIFDAVVANDTQVAKGIKEALRKCEAINATMTREPVTDLSQQPLVSFKTECK